MALSNLALEAILEEWMLDEYDPPETDIQQWIVELTSLCDVYGIPDGQRVDCAVKCIRSDLRVELEKVLKDARIQGPIHWLQFRNFIIAFDGKFRENWNNLPFYRKYPKLTGATLGIAGGVLLAPVAAFGALTAVGFTSGGIAAGSLAATIQSIVYGSATGGLFSLLQSAGATMVLPSVGAILTGVATTGAGIAVLAEESVHAKFSSDLARDHTGVDNDDDDDEPPPAQEFRLTHLAILAIVKSWTIKPYDPSVWGAEDWLKRVFIICELYEVPVGQRTLCAMYHMRADYRKAAHAAKCHDMSWAQFKNWILEHDKTKRASSSSRVEEKKQDRIQDDWSKKY